VNSAATPEPVFLLDRSLGQTVLAAALRGLGLPVRKFEEEFPDPLPDAEWLETAAKRRLVLLLRDRRPQYHRAAIVALRLHGIRAFILKARGNLTAKHMAEAFARAMPAMQTLLENNPAPFIATVQRNGLLKPLV
jgi:hypothetical protein